MGCIDKRVRLTHKSGEPMKSATHCRMCVRKEKRDVANREKEKAEKLHRWDAISARSQSARPVGQRAVTSTCSSVTDKFMAYIKLTENQTHEPMTLLTGKPMSLPAYGYGKRYAWRSSWNYIPKLGI